MKIRTVLASAMGMLLFLLSVSAVPFAPVRAASAAPSFTFSFAGDFPAYTGFSVSLTELVRSNSTFALALGDLGYGLVNESTWCAKFHRHFANVEIVAGSRDAGQAPPTAVNINTLINECPFTLNVPPIGVYGKEYYFDYPLANPLARFILISPDISFVDDPGAPLYNYSVGTPRYAWTAKAIDDARALGIPWVVVGMAKDCIGGGEHPCEIGTDLFNLLVEKKVDLVLQAHTHNYERSKQLEIGSACSGIVNGTYSAACVSEDGSNGTYQQGLGSVVVISGTGGREIEPFNLGGAYAPYFAAWMGNNSQNPSTGTFGNGFSTFTVTSAQISMRTYFNVSYQDSFTINGLPRPSTGSGSPSGSGHLLSIFSNLLVDVAVVVVVAAALVAVVVWRRARRKPQPEAPEDELDDS